MEASKGKGKTVVQQVHSGHRDWVGHPYNTSASVHEHVNGRFEYEVLDHEEPGNIVDAINSMFDEFRRDVFGEEVDKDMITDMGEFLKKEFWHIQHQQKKLNERLYKLQVMESEWKQQQQSMSPSFTHPDKQNPPTFTHLEEVPEAPSTFTYLDQQCSPKFTHFNEQQSSTQMEEESFEDLIAKLDKAMEEFNHWETTQGGWKTPTGIPICFYCKRQGHKQVFCRYRIRKWKRKQHQARNKNHNKQQQSTNSYAPQIVSVFWPKQQGIVATVWDKQWVEKQEPQTDFGLDTLFHG